MSNYFVGVDLGGTKILTAVADQKGNILADSKVATEVEKGEKYIINKIEKSIRSVAASAELNLEEIKRVGVGSPGPLSIKKGIVYETSNLPFKNFPIVEMLESKINIPVVLENDANAAALGEKLFGSGIDSNVMVYITISTGIGGGLIFGEKIFHGSNDGAGEVGHMIIDPSGPSCGFGQHEGCLEAMASGTAIVRNVKTELKNNPNKWLKKYDGKIEDVNGYNIAKAARNGDELAIEVYQEAGRYLGIGVANLINLFNPDTIVFGGGVMKARELFWTDMVKSVEKNALSASANDCEFLEAVLGDNTGVIGAISVAIKG